MWYTKEDKHEKVVLKCDRCGKFVSWRCDLISTETSPTITGWKPGEGIKVVTMVKETPVYGEPMEEYYHYCEKCQ